MFVLSSPDTIKVANLQQFRHLRPSPGNPGIGRNVLFVRPHKLNCCCYSNRWCFFAIQLLKICARRQIRSFSPVLGVKTKIYLKPPPFHPPVKKSPTAFEFGSCFHHAKKVTIAELPGSWVFPKLGVPPKSSHLNEVVHYFHHPFWGTTI